MTRPISGKTRAELVDEVVRLQQRNADLSAHVKRLYEALEELIDQCGHPNISGWVNIERAVDALDKARGEL